MKVSRSIRTTRVGNCPACDSTLASRVGAISDSLVAEMNRFLPPVEQLPSVTNEMSVCGSCGLRYLDPRIDVADLPALYDLWYGRIFLQTRIGGSEKAAREREFLTYHLPLLRSAAPAGSLLDVGAGTGLFVKLAGDAGYHALGLERSGEAIAYGRAVYGAEILHGVLTDVRSGPFDVMTMFDYLEHAERPREDVEAAVRLLKPGGALIVRVPNAGSWSSRLTGLAWVNVISFHLSYFDEASLSSLLARAGLHIDKVTKSNVQPLSTLLAHKVEWVRHRLERTKEAGAGDVFVPRAASGGIAAASFRFAKASTLELFEHVAGWFGQGSIMTIIARKLA